MVNLLGRSMLKMTLGLSLLGLSLLGRQASTYRYSTRKLIAGMMTGIFR